MPKKYTASDFRTHEKPRIICGKWQFGDRVYAYRCTGRNSTGYGTTPKDAFNAWERNFNRRKNFYTRAEERSAQVLEFYRRGE